MSTVKAINFQHPNAATPAIVLNAEGGGTIGGESPMGRNLVHNGAMQVAQRGTSVAGITIGGYYTADRWGSNFSSLGTWTQSVENDAPTGSGFRKSLKVLCTTADAALAAGDFAFIQHQLEGQDLQRICKGTASAKTLTLSFWVKSNVTGTHTIWVYDADNGRSVSAAYTVSVSATWEYKTVTLPADTTGAFDNDNAGSIWVQFMLAAGSNQTSGTLGTTWAADVVANRAVGQVNVAAAANNYWQVTGIQLETGSVTTPFEFRSYGDDLRTCQRYYHRYANSGAVDNFYGQGMVTGTSAIRAMVTLPTSMRVAPTIIDISSVGHFLLWDASVNPTTNAVTIAAPTSPNMVHVNASSASTTMTVGRAAYLYSITAAAYLGFSADL
jgi:hypothetical protein